MLKFNEVITAFCMSCNQWKEVGVFDDKYQLCPDCLCQAAIYIDPRISFKLNKKKSNIKFDWKNMKWIGISIEQIKIWEKLYPDIDIVHILNADMLRWLELTKDKKISHKSQWKEFIMKWLGKEQAKAVGIL